ncbi:MAG: substrate-binding domain-containing protein [Phycisphaerales bacterium]|nr:substrate-binding domain-containing protein [Phycisphaerales bacterium]
MLKSRRVALMLELEWPYKRHAGILTGAVQYAHEQGWETIIDEYADDTLPLRPAKTAPYDGVIARATRKLAQRAARNNVPVVNVWFNSPAAKSLPSVFADWSTIGRLRVEHLLTRGFRRFAVLTCRGDRSHILERDAFVSRLDELGYPCIVRATSLDATESLAQWRKNERTITAWMEELKPPIGVFVGADDEGRMVAQMCRNRGLRVPEDVAIITGDNEETFCERLRPTLSSVEVGFERIGYEAAGMLHRLMDDNKRSGGAGGKETPEHILLPPQGLVVRESTDFYAVDDEVVAAALEFIAAQSHRPIAPADVARAVITEQRTLRRRFSKHLGRSIAAEIRRVRIERAKRELTQTEQSIAAIARDVGFGKSMRMYEVFRRELGVTPSGYRKQRQIENGTQH